MEVFQLVCAAMVQGVGRPRARNVVYGCIWVHLCAAPSIRGAGMWRWKLLKVLVRYKLQLTEQKRERIIEVV